MYFRVFPCPSCLFLAIVRITRLRVLAATLGSESPELLSAARQIADEVYEFVHDRWTETYKLPDDPKIYTFARAFKAAIILYALLSLPQNLAQSFRRAEVANGQNSRLHYRNTLVKAVTTASALPLGMAGMCWPLAVLGVSLYDGTPDEQACIIGWLRDMESLSGVASGPVTLQQLLPEFWASGKRGWEDCFYKLSQVAA